MQSASSSETLIELARRVGGFDVFVAMIEQAGLVETLSGADKHTLFAPDDESFDKIPKSTLAKLYQSEHADLRIAVVKAHLIAGQVLTARLKGRRIRGASVEGSELVINSARVVSVNGATVVRPDLLASNGVIHGIDKLLWPKLSPKQAGSLQL